MMAVTTPAGHPGRSQLRHTRIRPPCRASGSPGSPPRSIFCTDTSASVADILGAVADRFSLEITLRDVKEVVRAGQQQVRFLHVNVGAFHICLWTYAMTEAWAWARKEEELVDRSASPWDKASRRPSHADKRRAWRRELLGEDIRAGLRPGVTEAEIQATADRLLSLAA